jgi:hypothetical protein
MMDTEVVSLENVRRSREWLDNYDRLQPFHDALCKEPEEAPVALFRLARKHRDWGIGRPRAVLESVRYQALLAGILLDEAGKIIRTAMYRSKREPPWGGGTA